MNLPALALGCATLGKPEVSEETAAATLDAALAAGIGYFDTAPLYGCGLSERRLGRALARHGGKRPMLSTKVGHVIDMPEGSYMAAERRRNDFSRDGIRRSLERSLGRLGVERVDLVYIHDPKPGPAQAEAAFAALDELRSEGLLDAIGAGTGSVAAALDVLRRCPIDAVLVAGRLTLLNREAETELLGECAARGAAIVAGGVFNSGILAAPDPAAANYDYAPADDARIALARDLARVCERFDATLMEAAVKFAARYDAVATTLLGAASANELSQCLSAFAREVPDALWPALDETARRHAV